MKHLFITIALSFFLIIGSSHAPSETKADEILKKLSKKITSYSSINMNFTYSMVNTKKSIKETLTGDILVSGKKYVLNFMDRVIISDGETQWVYSEDDEEVTINNVDDNDIMSNPFNILNNYSKDFRTQFINEKSGYYTIYLYPKTPTSYSRIALMINKEKMQIKSMKIEQKDGTYYRYVITTFKTNVSAPDSKFTFDKSKYPDVDVVDMR